MFVRERSHYPGRRTLCVKYSFISLASPGPLKKHKLWRVVDAAGGIKGLDMVVIRGEQNNHGKLFHEGCVYRNTSAERHLEEANLIVKCKITSISYTPCSGLQLSLAKGKQEKTCIVNV